MLAVTRTTAQTTKRPDIIGIASVQLQVTDLQKASTFYEKLLGYTILLIPDTITMQPVSRITINHRQSIRLHGDLPAGQTERLLSLDLQTTDVEGMRRYLKSKGIQVPDKLSKATRNTLSFSIKDPDQHTITFVQFVPGAGGQPSLKPLAGNAISDRILHAGLTISNAATADNFYKDILGFSEIWRGGANDSVTSWINMRLPESTDYLEYMLVNAPPDKQQLGSLHHIALLVPDMQKAVDVLRVRAAKTHYELAPPRIGRNNRWQLNLYDADGTRIELMEPFPMRDN